MNLYTPPTVASGERIRYAPTTGYVRSFEILMQCPNRVRMILQKTVPFSFLPESRCGAYAIRPYDWVRVRLRKTVSSSFPSRSRGGRIQYAPTTGYVRFFEIPLQFPNRVRMALLKTVSFSSLLALCVGRIQYAPTTGYV